jgi:hypothetical protein
MGTLAIVPRHRHDPGLLLSILLWAMVLKLSAHASSNVHVHTYIHGRQTGVSFSILSLIT